MRRPGRWSFTPDETVEEVLDLGRGRRFGDSFGRPAALSAFATDPGPGAARS